MASVLGNCTEVANSTDCLLQALITILEESQKNDNSYNWDPITFAFTVGISLCAAIFASITILQAVLVAGPGRRKSDYRAIGKWATKRERKWSWRDFSFIHIAYTPVLLLERLEWACVEKVDASYNSSTNKVDMRAATWVQFLCRIGLHHLDTDAFTLIPRIADYLPTDLLAAPAYADIGFIVTTMSLINAEIRLKSDDKYPSMKRMGCQFEIRQHATLGLIGSFSDYNPTRAWYPPISQPRVPQAVKFSFGFLRVTWEFSLGSFRYNRDIEYTFHICDHLSGSEPGAVLREMRDPNVWEYAFYFFPLHLLMQKNPSFVIHVFPWGRVHHHWQYSLVVMDLIRPFGAFLSAAQYYQQGTHLQGEILGTGDSSCGLCRKRAQFPCHVLREACFSMIQGVAEFRNWLTKVSFVRVVELRGETLEQIGILDRWIMEKEREPDHDTSRRYSLFKNTVTAINIIQAFDPGVELLGSSPRSPEQSLAVLTKFIEAFPAATLQNLTGEHFKDDERLRALQGLFDPALDIRDGEERHHDIVRRLVAFRTWWDGRDAEKDSTEYNELLMNNVIIWRATLIAVLFCLANDNTALLDSGVWHEIIPIM